MKPNHRFSNFFRRQAGRPPRFGMHGMPSARTPSQWTLGPRKDERRLGRRQDKRTESPFVKFSLWQTERSRDPCVELPFLLQRLSLAFSNDIPHANNKCTNSLTALRSIGSPHVLKMVDWEMLAAGLSTSSNDGQTLVDLTLYGIKWTFEASNPEIG